MPTNDDDHGSDREGRRHLDEISDPEDIAEEEEWFFGLRRTLRRTTWLYRDDALTPSRIRDMADEFVSSLLLYDASLYVVVWILMLTTYIQHQSRLAVDNFLHMKVFVLLTGVLDWMLCRGYRFLLDVEDSLYFIRRRVRFSPEVKRTISSLSQEEAYDYTGFSKQHLRKLLRHLRFPPFFECGGFIISGESALIIYLYQLRHGYSFTSMARDIFGGDPRKMTYIVRAAVHHIYNNFYHKISGRSMSMWTQWITVFRYAIWLRLVNGAVAEISEVVENGWILVGSQIATIWIAFESFRPFGFVDDFGVATARPGDSPTRRFGFIQDIQRAYYR